MCNEYKYYKKEILKKEIEHLEIYFDNGDAFKIKKNEIKDFSVNYSDKLLWENNSIHRSVSSGVIKLKILHTKLAKYCDAQVFNMKEFIRDRKGVIENRCVSGGIKFIDLVNDYNWNCRLYGDIVARLDGDYLLIEFKESDKYPNTKEYSSIYLDNITKKDIYRLQLDFENCEMLDISQDEIVELNIKLSNQLKGDFSDLERVIESGYIKIKLDDEITKRENGLFEDATNKYFQKRICGKGTSKHDICHLYITYNYCTRLGRKECIDIDEIRPYDELEIEDENDDCPKDGWYFVGGYAKIDKNRIITIAFGKDSLIMIDKI